MDRRTHVASDKLIKHSICEMQMSYDNVHSRRFCHLHLQSELTLKTKYSLKWSYVSQCCHWQFLSLSFVYTKIILIIFNVSISNTRVSCWLGDGSFAVAGLGGLCIWNMLPASLHLVDDCVRFKCLLKALLFDFFCF